MTGMHDMKTSSCTESETTSEWNWSDKGRGSRKARRALI